MIFISAGHHPAAPGACYEGFCEYEEAVRWVEVMEQLFGGLARKVPTGHLRDKVKYINSHYPTFALEVHFNSAVGENNQPIGKGCETLYYPGSKEGRRIAKVVQSALASIFPPNRGAKEGWYRMNPRFGPDYFLAGTKCPAIIIEPEFIHRREVIEANRNAGCEIIVEAVLEALDYK